MYENKYDLVKFGTINYSNNDGNRNDKGCVFISDSSPGS
jgi:hypothetical protein